MFRNDVYIDVFSKGKLSGMTQVIKLQNVSSRSLNVDKRCKVKEKTNIP